MSLDYGGRTTRVTGPEAPAPADGRFLSWPITDAVFLGDPPPDDNDPPADPPLIVEG